MQQAYRLRYDVYCLERRFLDSGAYPDGLERDNYDSDSEHFHSYNHKNELVGYSRLIVPDVKGHFPWQIHCNALLAQVELPPRQESAEISRLVVRQDYRRRCGDTPSRGRQRDVSDPKGVEWQLASPQILLVLYRQMYHYSLAHGIRCWYAAMEHPLARSLQMMNFSFVKIGPEADYFGPVAPYIADLRALERRLGQSNPEMLAWMQMPERNNA